jgi:hypothetical protein
MTTRLKIKIAMIISAREDPALAAPNLNLDLRVFMSLSSPMQNKMVIVAILPL